MPSGSGGQGVHVIGDFPSDSSGTPVSNGSAADWTVQAQAGGQALPSLSTEGMALCEGPASQTIEFTAPVSGIVGTAVTLGAAGGASFNPVIFTVDPTRSAGVCTASGFDGSALTYLVPGTCVINANQAGNAFFAAAKQVVRTIPVVNAGYRLIASDGGIFSFHAPFFGSTGNIPVNSPIVGMTTIQS